MADKHPRTDDESEDERKKATKDPFAPNLSRWKARRGKSPNMSKDTDQAKQLEAKDAKVREAEYTVELVNVYTSQPLDSESAEQGHATPSPPAQSSPRTLNRRFGKLAVSTTTQRALPEQTKASDSNSAKAESADTDTDIDTALWRVRSLHLLIVSMY